MIQLLGRAGVAALNVCVSGALVVASVVTSPDRAAVFGLVALVGVGLEGVAPRLEQKRTLASLLVDLTHAIGNRLPIIAGLSLLLAWLDPAVGALTPEGLRTWYAGLDRWLAIGLLFVVTDACNYAFHRASHEVPWLWRLHRVHHSSAQVDWLATARGHPLDQVLAFAAITLPAMVFGAVESSALLIVFLFVYPFVCHANIRWSGGGLDAVLVTPRFHHWHHADCPEAVNRNYGAILTIWDRLLGTSLRSREFPSRYGTPDLVDGANPRYLDHLVSPLVAPHPPGDA